MSTGDRSCTAQRILIVEDEEHLANGLRFNLQAEGYAVTVLGDGEVARAALLAGNVDPGMPGQTAPSSRETNEEGRSDLAQLPSVEVPFDAVLLDVMLPGCDGFSVVAAMRSAGVHTPVLLLTARGRPEDVLRGFAAGADDYLPKPFDLSILLARLSGLLRRTAWARSASASPPARAEVQQAEPSLFRFADRTIDFAALELSTPSRTIRLTVMEADLLRYLIQKRGRIVSRKELLEQVWRVHESTDTRAIDNFIVRLRRYLEEDPSRPVFLETVRGIGYRFRPQA